MDEVVHGSRFSREKGKLVYLTVTASSGVLILEDTFRTIESNISSIFIKLSFMILTICLV